MAQRVAPQVRQGNPVIERKGQLGQGRARASHPALTTNDPIETKNQISSWLDSAAERERHKTRIETQSNRIDSIFPVHPVRARNTKRPQIDKADISPQI